MKIGVNARFLTNPYTGIGQYTRFLFEEILNIDKENEYFLMTPEAVPFDKTCIYPELSYGPAFLKKGFWEQYQISKFFKNEKVDLMHFPYPSGPWRACDAPYIVTIHDTIPWDFPEYRKSLRSKFYHYQTKKACAKASKIITVSETSKKDILRHLKIPSDRIEVIYNAASPVFSHKVSEERRKAILDKYGLEKPFFIYVGGYDKRKNVNLLLDVYKNHVSKECDVDLVLVGGKVHDSALYSSFDNLTETGNSSNIHVRKKGRIKKLGFLPNEELAALYQSSLCFLHFSLKEGFNIPIVEAAESGTAILLSDTEIHREIAGGASEYVSLEYKEGIADKLCRIASDEKYREELALKTSKLRGKYTWEKAALKTLKIYNSR